MPRGRSARVPALGLAAALVALVALLLALPAPAAGSAAPASLGVRAGAHPAGSPDLAVSIVGTTLRGSAPFTVHLSAIVSGGTGAYSVYAWDVGDGQTEYGAHLAYTFRDQGNYTVQLNVTDNIGDWGRAGVTVFVGAAVAPPPPPFYGSVLFDALLAAAVAIATVAASSLQLRSSRRRTGPAGGTGGPAGPTRPPGFDRAGPARASVLGARGPSTGSNPVNGAPLVDPVGTSADALRLSQRIIVHLARQGALHPGEVASMERTQVGLSRRFGASQSSVSNLLQRLAAAGVVSSDSRHVAGHPRRLRVYALTAYGQEIARDLREKATPARPMGSFLPPVTVPAPIVAVTPATESPAAAPRPERNVRASESGSEGVV